METRRTQLARLGAATCLMMLGEASKAFGGSAGRELSKWIIRVDEICAALRGEAISIQEWRDGLDQILFRVDLSDVMRDIDFTKLRAAAGFAERGVATANVTFDDDTHRLSFYPKMFAVDRGRSIIPHGHDNMVSAHLALSGRFHLLQYDQISRDDHALVIRPSADEIIVPGALSSIGDDDDNVHWFIAEEPSHTFDVIVSGLDAKAEKTFDIFNLDMNQAAPLGNGLLRAPRIGVDEALEKYG